MYTTLLKCKIHRARVTEADLHYEGSCSIDLDLMKAAGLVAHEHVHVWNITNGNRFETYVIEAARGSGMIKINGAAAHQAKQGDLVIITSFAHFDAKESRKHKPKIVFVDNHTRIRNVAHKSGRKDPLPVI